jgi:hypothetical protein
MQNKEVMYAFCSRETYSYVSISMAFQVHNIIIYDNGICRGYCKKILSIIQKLDISSNKKLLLCDWLSSTIDKTKRHKNIILSYCQMISQIIIMNNSYLPSRNIRTAKRIIHNIKSITSLHNVRYLLSAFIRSIYINTSFSQTTIFISNYLKIDKFNQMVSISPFVRRYFKVILYNFDGYNTNYFRIYNIAKTIFSIILSKNIFKQMSYYI